MQTDCEVRMTWIFQSSLKLGVMEPHITSHRSRQAASMPIFHGPIPMTVGDTHGLMKANCMHYNLSLSLSLSLSIHISLALTR